MTQLPLCEEKTTVFKRPFTCLQSPVMPGSMGDLHHVNGL